LTELGIRFIKIMGSGEAGAIVIFIHNKEIDISKLKFNYPYLMKIELEKHGARIAYSTLKV
jgi:hypothetical protein